MKITITPDGVILRLSFQEYAATSAALVRHANFSKEAEALVRAGLPKIQDKGPIMFTKADKCPKCGSVYFSEQRQV